MKKDKSEITCPNCGYDVDVNQLLYQQLETEVKNEYKLKFTKLDSEKLKLDNEKKEMQTLIEKGVQSKLSLEKSKLEDRLRSEISEEKSDEIKNYQQQLDKKIAEAKELNRIKADYSRLERESAELKEKIEAEAESKVTEIIRNEKAKLKKEYEDKALLKVSEKDHIIDQLKDQLQIAQRKAEQGSMQIQGEVQELVIENWLKTSFPMDVIGEVAKGVRGADCIHTVMHHGNTCGTIYYESKRTKGFQNSWIEKFKDDMRQKGATFGVIVTDSMPKGMERIGQRENVWICSVDEFKGLCFVLRESVMLLHNANQAQENKAEKTAILYNYLTGNEFRMHIEAIVEGFSQMSIDLESERRAMESIWKKREKQIRKVIQNTSQVYGSVKGIAGSAINPIKQLEI